MTVAVSPVCYRVRAEWEPQACVWLSWPHNLETWPDTVDPKQARFEKIPDFFAGWARLIAESTPVRILAAGDAAKQSAALLGGASNVDIVDIATNDCWIRDYGPSFVVNLVDGSIHGINWKFNSWGGKYPPWDLDDEVAPKLCTAADISCVDGALCLEGGALEVDGLGRVLTTPECLITETRNPGWTKDQISLELHRRLGVTEILWLDGGGLVGDDTDGHIDQLARFIDRENVVVAVSDPDNGDVDVNSHPLEDNFRQLQLWGDTTDPNVTVHRLPIPPARYLDGRRVPESYCNFLRLGRERLLVPTFAAKTDDHALGLLRELSGAEVTGVDCQDLVWGLGALHCASRDQPA
jgi:agmatine deiminase